MYSILIVCDTDMLHTILNVLKLFVYSAAQIVAEHKYGSTNISQVELSYTYLWGKG